MLGACSELQARVFLLTEGVVLCRAKLRKVEEQPADDDKYVKTSYGVAAIRCR